MPYKEGQDIGGFGRLAEIERWKVGQKRLDRQEARQTELFNLQMKETRANVAEIQRGREFKLGMAQATSAVSGAPEKFHARMDYYDEMEATHPDLVEAGRAATFERADKMTDDLYDTDPEAATYMEDQLIGEYHRRRGQENFKISYVPEDKTQKIEMQDGSVEYHSRIYDQESKSWKWQRDMEGLPGGVGRKPSGGMDVYDAQGNLIVSTSGAKAAGAGAKKYAETRAVNRAARENELNTLANNASESRHSITTQRALIDEGLATGKLQPMLNSVAGYVEDIGVDAEQWGLPDPAKGEAFNMVSFKNLLAALAAQKGPQTEGDALRAMKTFATLENTEDGNKFILDYLEAYADRTEYMADFTLDMAADNPNDPRALEKAEREFRKWNRSTPLVAKSPNNGLPVTYTTFSGLANSPGTLAKEGREEPYTREEIDIMWRSFAAGGM